MRNVILFLSILLGIQPSMAGLSDHECSQLVREVLDLRQKKETVFLKQILEEYSAPGYDEYIMALNNQVDSKSKVAAIEQIHEAAKMRLTKECSPYYLKILNFVEK